MSIDLDEMMEAEKAAKWMKLTKAKLLEKSKGYKPEIPGFWLNERVVRYHPRTIISALAKRAGVSPETIAASMGLERSENAPRMSHRSGGVLLR